MVRKSGRNRSVSAGSYTDLSTPTSNISNNTGALKKQSSFSGGISPSAIDAANDLFEIAYNIDTDTDFGKSTFLHRMVSPASSADSSSHRDVAPNMVLLANILLARARRVDGMHNQRGDNAKQQQQQQQRYHLRKFLLCRDKESGYTPLHASMFHRKLSTVLLLLRHGGLYEDDDVSASKKTHPIALLEQGGGAFTAIDAPSSSSSLTHLLSHMTGARDNEGLTPLALLCQSLSTGLTRCRTSLVSKYRLMAKLASGTHDDARRLRSCSFHSLDEEDEDDDDDEIFGYEYDIGVDVRTPRKSNQNEFSRLRERSNSSVGNNNKGLFQPIYPIPSKGYDYGCEVLTFGRADHCALGVPNFASRRIENNIKTGRTTTTGVGSTGMLSDSKASDNAARPRRVEAFALGEMGRRFDPEEGSGLNHGLDCRDHGPAVAVAAAAHHTLVSTRKGYLFAFGLGKGGRLGTGDENHRPLPTRVLGPLSNRQVISIAAAINHSLCVTSDGGVYAWGSNRFGQLGTFVDCDKKHATPSSARSGTTSKMHQHHHPQHQNPVEQRCVPRRVDDLKHEFIVMVAAGDRHSVALTKRGEVYTWGDNRAGQLGMSVRGEDCHGCTTPHRVNALWSASPRRVTISIAASELSTLVLTLPPADATASASLPVNAVYGWGHGNHLPVKVNFPLVVRRSVRSQQKIMKSADYINPTGIACAKYHNVAITVDGKVYTWGMHSEPLGTAKATSKQQQHDWPDNNNNNNGKKASSPSSMVIASPQIVTGMLPEHGGGIAVAVSASENHTAVVTEAGYLYTWGATYGNDVLGHEGVRWQPSPRKVPGVHRAVGLAAAREHTVLLIGTAFPPLPIPRREVMWGERELVLLSKQSVTRINESNLHQPSLLQDIATIPVPWRQLVDQEQDLSSFMIDDGCFHQPSLLKDIAAKKVAQHVDLYNVIPILITAERISCQPLIDYCMKFIKMNLDGVLSLAKKTDLDSYLNEILSSGECMFDDDDVEKDAQYHPLLMALAAAGTKHKDRVVDNKHWIESCVSLLQNLPIATLSKIRNCSLKQSKKDQSSSSSEIRTTRRSRGYSFSNTTTTTTTEHQTNPKDQSQSNAIDICSEKVLQLTSDMNLSDACTAKTKFDLLSKELRASKKKLSQITELETNFQHDAESFSTEQREKLARRPLLEANLVVLQPAMEEVEKMMRHFSISEKLRRDNQSHVEMEKNGPDHTVENALHKKDTSPPPKDETVTPPPIPKHHAKTNNSNDEPSYQTPESIPTSFRCSICKVTCPDENSYALHRNGRKHRNRMRQNDENAEKETAASMMKMKRRQMISSSSSSSSSDPNRSSKSQDSSRSSLRTNKDVTLSIQPKYKLPSPPTFVEVDAMISSPRSKKSSASSSSSSSWTIQPKTPKNISSFQKILDEEEKRSAARGRERIGSNEKSKKQVGGVVSPMSSPWGVKTSPPGVGKVGTILAGASKSNAGSSPWATKSPPPKMTKSGVAKAAVSPVEPSTPTTNSSPWGTKTPKPNTNKIGTGKTAIAPSGPSTPGATSSISSHWAPKTPKSNTNKIGTGKAATSPPTPSTPNTSSSPWTTKSPKPKSITPKSNPTPSHTPQSAKHTKPQTHPASSPSISLGSFLDTPPSKPKHDQTKPSPTWSHHTTPPPPPPPSSQTTSLQDKKSFHTIQQEEEELKSKSQSTGELEKKWFVERRERGCSLGEIQEKEEKMRLFVEEQKEIEEQIYGELRREKEEKEKDERRKNGRRGGGGGGGGRRSNRGKVKGENGRRRKKREEVVSPA